MPKVMLAQKAPRIPDKVTFGIVTARLSGLNMRSMNARNTPSMPDTKTAQPDAGTAVGILVVDDHELVRLGFRALVQSQCHTARPALTLYEANTLSEALALYGEYQLHIAVVVLDLSLPDSKGPSGLMTFRQQFPDATIVVLSGTDSPAVMQNVLALGAAAFFPKSGEIRDMMNYVHACTLHGAELPGRHFSPLALTRGVSTSVEPHEYSSLAGEPLSSRQLQILQWLLDGKSNREISQLALLSEGTVKNHVSTLLLSFGVRSRAQLISKLRS